MNNRSTFLKFVIWGVLFTLAMTGMVMADEVNARIRGTVTDQSGAVIPGVKVTATNIDTGISKDVVSEENGSYEFLQLPVGNYKVAAEKSGFRAYSATGIRLVVSQIFVQNINLEVGDVTQEVSVQANAAQVETTSMQLGAVVTGSTIVDLPLNGRNWVQLQQLQPGVVASSDRFGSNFATNGAQSQQNSYMINGTDANDLPLNTPLIIPSPDAIAEFRLVTNTINPEYGRNSGGILNAITKSGTNGFHGSAFDFFRDTSLNARNFFAVKPQIFHQNQFGGTIGGPIWKNHTFFFFSYQGVRARQPDTNSSGQTTVFTQDQRNGIFPGIAKSTVLSPFALTGEDGKLHPAGTAYNVLFPTGHIPSADFNSISSNLLSKFVPLPNLGTTDFTFNPVNKQTTDQEILRIDHTFSARDSIYGNWFIQRAPSISDTPFTGSTLPGFGQVSLSHSQQYTAAWNHVFNDRMLNEARFGYTRLNFAAVFPQTPTLPSTLGFTINPQLPDGAGAPFIGLTGFFSLGFSTNGPQPRIDQTYQATDNFSMTHGRHTLKFGFDMRRFEVYNPFSAVNNGSFTFGAAGAFTTGNAGADFLLGIPDSFSQGSGGLTDARAQQYYSYAQDQFKVRPNLTLTFGVGWQIDTPIGQKAFGGHGLNAFRPGQQSTVFPTAPVGYVFPGDTGVNATGETKFNHFGPRFGFAWSPDWGWLSGGPGKMSIRGGYGIYFNRSEEEVNLQFVGGPPFGTTAFGAENPSFAKPYCDISTGACVANPFPFGGPSANIDFSQFFPMSVSTVDPNFTSPYAQNFNLTVERQLPHDMIFTTAYVGSLAHKNTNIWELNPGINPKGCAASPSCVANRTVQGLVAPQNFIFDPGIFASIGNVSAGGNSNYNALQFSLNKHFSRGLQFLASYTWSHALDNSSSFENSGFGGGAGPGLDPFNRRNNYGNSAYDARQRLVFSYVYEIPSVRNFSALEKLPSRLTDGWRITGILSLQEGFPIYPMDTASRSLTCQRTFSFFECPDRPNSLGPQQIVDVRSGQFVNATRGGTTSNDHYYFNPNTFAVEPLGTIGNAGRGNFAGPGINNFDFSLMKDTKITETTRVELRFEFFNLFNHTQFNNPTNNINSANFGRVTTARSPRIVQLAAKFYF